MTKDMANSGCPFLHVAKFQVFLFVSTGTRPPASTSTPSFCHEYTGLKVQEETPGGEGLPSDQSYSTCQMVQRSSPCEDTMTSDKLPKQKVS